METPPGELPPPPEPLGEPRPPSPRFVGLMLALVVSLLVNGILALRLRDAEDREQALRARVEDQQGDLEALRGGIRGTSDDPLMQIATAVEQLRGLQFRRTVRPELLSPAAFRERVREAIGEDQDRDEVEASAKVLVALGLLPPDVDLFEILTQVQEEQVAGFYDTDRRRLVVGASDAKEPSPFDQVILAHEYTHALTDQYFDLERLDGLQDDDKDDEASAYLSLIEGDATLTMALYQDQVLTDDEKARFTQEAAEIPRQRFDALPTFLQEVLEFPYTRGVDFARELYRRGGFELVDRAYRDPPVSTEQILHPSRYLDERDDPTEVDLPDVRGALGSGWRRLERGGIGELDVRLLADQYLPFADARNAAAGWDGGRYVGLSSSKGTLVAALTTWDSTREAAEAARALGRWLPLRFRNEGGPMTVEDGTGRGWNGLDGAGMVLRHEGKVLILVGPDEQAVRAARAAFVGF